MQNDTGTDDLYTRWQANADMILSGTERGAEIKNVFFTLLEAINGMKWRGACHSASVLLCVLFREMGLNAVPCTGMVASYPGCFSHSWVEVDGKVYDATIWLQNRIEVQISPVMANIHLDTGEETTSLYGIDWLPLESDVSDYINHSFAWLMNCSIETAYAPPGFIVWDVLFRIAKRLKLPLPGLGTSSFNTFELREKYKDLKLVHIKRYSEEHLTRII